MYERVDSHNMMEGIPMSHETSWMAKAAALAVVAVAGLAVMTALDAVGQPVIDNGLGGSTVCTAGHGAGPGTVLADDVHAVDLGQQEHLADPTAICRLRPECMSDSDCDVICGVGQGKCIHSNCPVRICRCG